MMTNTSFKWPAAFRPDGQLDLVRVGSEFDGGYIFSADLIASAQYILTYGLGLNWDFERDICDLAEIEAIHCYDHTITQRKLLSNLFFSALRFPFKTSKRIRNIKAVIDYYRFFSGAGPAKHFPMMVGNKDSDNQTTIAATFKRLPTDADNIVLKCDIEGGEYGVLNELIASAPLCTGIAIEFHDTGSHLATVENAMIRLRETHHLDHFHINNAGGSDAKGIPSVIELTFTRKDVPPRSPSSLTGLMSQRKTTRSGTELDSPNKSGWAEIDTHFV